MGPERLMGFCQLEQKRKDISGTGERRSPLMSGFPPASSIGSGLEQMSTKSW